MKRLAIAALMAAVCAWCLMGCGAKSDFDLVVMTPHDEKITQEFEQAFAAHFKKARGRVPKISWRDMGSGTETQVRFIEDRFARSPGGIGFDIFFGGGIDPYKKLTEKGLLVAHVIPNADAIPAELVGVPLLDKDHHWYGAVLSSFGILYNKQSLARLGVGEPKTWEDMAEPRLMGNVGLADPSRSGSARMIYETILQAYGWEKGMRIITLMSANALDFYDGSSSLAKEVTMGEAAMGPVIDFYGRTQVAQGGADRLGYVTPQSLSVITPDPIAILKGAPNLDTAKMFVDFVMSEEGQRLWFLKAGSPGGPAKYNLMRSPILPQLYDRYDASVKTVEMNPFTFKGSFSFDAVKATARRELLGDLMTSTLVQPQKDLRACWKAVLSSAKRETLIDRMVKPPLDEAAALELARTKWEDKNFRARTTTDWVQFAVKKYADVKADAQ